jgi:hypothetical protein
VRHQAARCSEQAEAAHDLVRVRLHDEVETHARQDDRRTLDDPDDRPELFLEESGIWRWFRIASGEGAKLEVRVAGCKAGAGRETLESPLFWGR